MEEPISTLLAKAVASPKHLHTKDGSDAVVLCLHCLMVEAGYRTIGEQGSSLPGFAPPPSWRGHPHEWLISYTRSRAQRVFRLHCSLQPATGRLFIHASELGAESLPRRENIQVLGLQLSNYADADVGAQGTWEGNYCEITIITAGVIKNERTLKSMFREFVLVPLWESAEKDPEEEPSTKATAGNDPAVGNGVQGDVVGKNWHGKAAEWGWPRGPSAAGIAVATGAVVVLAAYYVIRYRTRSNQYRA